MTIDDVRWRLAGGRPPVEPPLSDRLTYSTTVNRDAAIQLQRDAEAVIVIAGDAVPSIHLHAVNGAVEEITRALACKRGRSYPLGSAVRLRLVCPYAVRRAVRAVHTHTVTSGTLLARSRPARPTTSRCDGNATHSRASSDRCPGVRSPNWTRAAAAHGASSATSATSPRSHLSPSSVSSTMSSPKLPGSPAPPAHGRRGPPRPQDGLGVLRVRLTGGRVRLTRGPRPPGLRAYA